MSGKSTDKGGISWLGVGAIGVFYLLILIVGLGASWWKTRKSRNRENQAKNSQETSVIVADRSLGMVVGVFTLTATWVGGGYINGTAESVFLNGIISAQAPIGYGISLLLDGVFFAKTMRDRAYMTMIDPFQEKYGRKIGSLAYLPALCGELMWSASILNALGTTVAVILGIDQATAVLISAFIAVAYTFLGGLYSVAYTDVAQLICIAVGLVTAIPFAWNNEHVRMDFNATGMKADGKSFPKWLGHVQKTEWVVYIDTMLLIIFGGIPWQCYFQRVLAAKSGTQARNMSIVGSFGCIIMSIPPILIGLIAQNVVHSEEMSGLFTEQQAPMILPEVLRYLTNGPVMFIGLGAVSAAVMSSSDSSFLSVSSIFAHNIYKTIFRQNASDREVVWVLRCAVLAAGALSCSLALLVSSVYTLFVLCGDLVYVLLFPQLCCVLYFPKVNSYGLLAGLSVGLTGRLLIGEQAIHLNPVIAVNYEQVPIKTLCMLANFIATVMVSLVSSCLIVKCDRKNLDFLNFYSLQTKRNRFESVDYGKTQHEKM